MGRNLKKNKCKVCNKNLTEKQIKKKRNFCSSKCSGKFNGKNNYKKLREWYKNNPGFNNMKRKEISKKSHESRLKSINKWRSKLSNSLKGNKNSLGAKRSKETIEKLSKQKIGNNFGSSKYFKRTKEYKKRISESNKKTAEKLIKEGKHVLQRLKRITYSEDKFAKMHPNLIRQFPIKRFLADFYDKETNTIIEIDGSMHSKKERILHDKKRDKIIKKLGYKIIRIPAKKVIENNFIDWRSERR